MKGNTKALNSYQIVRTLFSISTVSFAMLIIAMGFLMMNPPRVQKVDAAQSAAAPKVTVGISNLISLAMDDSINVAVSSSNISSADLVESDPTSITVTTNVPNGYILYLSDLDSNTNLVNTDLSSVTIPTLDTINPATSGTTYTAEQFTVNRWGYSIDGSKTYKAITTSRSVIKAADTAKTNDVTNLSVAVKVNTEVPAGAYEDIVLVSAVPNSTYTSKWEDIDTMQAMTPEICASAPTASSSFTATKALYDIRDGKAYFVSRLKDGNCWMTQDLALDWHTEERDGDKVIKDGTVFTSADTDLNSKESWTPNNTTQTSSGTAWDASTDRSYSNGTLYYTPGAQGGNATKRNNLNACLSAGYNADECQHFKSGNFYNWTAATAGSGIAVTAGGQVAQDSICPKGWQLPVNGGSSVNKSWESVTSKYFTSSDAAYKTYTAQQAPLYLVRSGNYYTNGNLNYQANNMYYWSATASSGTNAYRLGADASGWGPQNNYYRGYGFSVRCVAR